MQTALKDAALSRQNMHDTMLAVVSFGLPQVFNVEWLIDRAEKGEWGGLWW